MKYLIFFICLSLSNTLLGQTQEGLFDKERDADYIMKNFVDSLKRSKIVDIITVSRKYEGMPIADSIGIPTSSQYIFWVKDSNNFFQKITAYFDHEVVKGKPKLIAESEIFYFANINYNSIKDDFILPFIRKFIYKNIECYELRKSLHRGFNAISIYNKENVIHKEFEDSDLRYGSAPDFININSSHNNDTKLKMLWDLLFIVITNEN